MKVGSLCSGYGGLDIAVENVFHAETVWHAEVDPSASKVLAQRWDVPNHGDLTRVAWNKVEPIDILCAGWPCQPWSLAGKQKGAQDVRAIWPEIARAVRELRPRYVVLENVSAVVVLGELARAAGDLAEARYDAQWTCLSASEVGAPHKRERFFIVAADTDNGAGYGEWSCTQSGEGSQVAGGIDLLPTPRTTDANGVGQHGQGGDDLRTAIAMLPTPRASRGAATTETAYALGGVRSDEGDRQGNVILESSSWGKYAAAIERWEQVTRPAPSPTELNSRGNPRLSARFAEWMMGLPAGWVTDVDLPRSAHLKILGNGVVPLQAEAALLSLLSLSAVA